MIDKFWDESRTHISYEEYSDLNIEPMYECGALFNLSEVELSMHPINMDELITDKAIRYINEKKECPFFLYIVYALVHSPMEYHSEHPVRETFKIQSA